MNNELNTTRGDLTPVTAIRPAASTAHASSASASASAPSSTASAVLEDPHAALLRELAAQGEERRYRKGTILIHELDVGTTLFIVLSGQVKVFSTDASDKEITFGVFGAGEYFGEMSLDGGPRSASVITTEPTVCALVSRTTLVAFIARQPEFALALLSKVIRRLRMATTSARNLAFVDVYGRLTGCLHALAKPQSDGTLRIEERITHQEIASRAGCSREMVSRILKDLENGGYIRVEQRRIVLVKKLPARW
jgi:CRP/FNR family transcriptional regulator, cyclic AMP receptor protein